jgi:hypothetical protein
MAAKSGLTIRAAVMHCLSRCTESAAPLCCLGEFLEKLGTLGWESSDIQAVETAVLYRLGRMKEDALQAFKPGRGAA